MAIISWVGEVSGRANVGPRGEACRASPQTGHVPLRRFLPQKGLLLPLHPIDIFHFDLKVFDLKQNGADIKFLNNMIIRYNQEKIAPKNFKSLIDIKNLTLQAIIIVSGAMLVI